MADLSEESRSNPELAVNKKYVKEEKHFTTMEEEANNILSTVETTETAQLSLTDLAPKKANWDLKRDLLYKMDILEEQTQQAYREVIKKRLEEAASAASKE